MKEFYRLKSASIPEKIAFASFFCGTFTLVSTLLLSNYYQMMVIGFAFLILAFVVNSIALLVLLWKLMSQPKNKKQIGRDILTLLCNIPIAALYIFILIYHNIL